MDNGEAAGQLRRLLRGAEHILAVVGQPRVAAHRRLQVGTVYVNRRAVEDLAAWGQFPDGSLLLYRPWGARTLAAVRVQRGWLCALPLAEAGACVPWGRLIRQLRGRARRGEPGYRTRTLRRAPTEGRE